MQRQSYDLNGVYLQMPYRNAGSTPRSFDYRIEDCLGLPCRIRNEPLSPTTMHLACFVGFMLLMREVATIDEVLGDYGLVHELAHFREFGPGCSPHAATVETLACMTEGLVERLVKGRGNGKVV